MLSTLPWRRSKGRSARQGESAPKRRDIQGLRAVAVGVVLLYHAGMPWLPGGFVGVDVFFVISGYLISLGLVKELRRNGNISLKDFYARRISRILPAASLAIVSTLVLAWLLLPETRWRQIGWDGFASAFSYVNWVFAGNSVNYLAQANAESPFQHFWSLAVEEQFYLVWPLLLLIVGWLSLKLNFRLQRGMLTALAIVAIPSFAWSVYLTTTNPGAAYFVTTTRGWELAAGCALAIVTNRSAAKAPKIVAAIVGWIGLIAIFAAAALFTSATPFPSYTAALPVLGAVAVIWAGAHAGAAGPGLLLNRAPMVGLGNISYSMYLWHWPLLVIAAGVWGKLDPAAGLIVVAVSVLPAWASYKFVELRVQRWLHGSQSKWDSFSVGIMVTTGGAAGALILSLLVPPVPPSSSIVFVPTPMAGQQAAAPVGAETLLDPATPRVVVDTAPNVQPGPIQAANDLPLANTNGCMQDIESSEARRCDFGDLSGSKTIAVVGDSHAAMFLPGLERLAADKGWKIISYTKGACPWAGVNVNQNNRPFSQCLQWSKSVSTALLADRPSLIVTGTSHYRTNDGSVDDADVSRTKMINGLRNTWAPFTKAGIPVVSIRDTPQPGIIVPDCIAKNPDALSKCAVQKSKVLASNPPEVAATDGVDGLNVLDLTDAFCFDDTCPAVIGGTMVYRDDNHLTATYSRSLHGQLEKVLAPLLEPAR